MNNTAGITIELKKKDSCSLKCMHVEVLTELIGLELCFKGYWMKLKWGESKEWRVKKRKNEHDQESE